MGRSRRLRHRERRAEPRGQPAAALPRRDLVRAGLLDLRRRAAADRRPDARRLRHRRLAVPVHRHDRLPDRPAARVPGGRARARARDRGRRGAAGEHRAPGLPVLRLRGREGVPALPELPAPAEGAVRASAASRSTRAGRSARTARPRSARRPPEAPARRAPGRGARAARPRRAVRQSEPARASSRDRPQSAGASRPAASHEPERSINGPDPDPGEARRVRARPDRRGHRPLRAQGAHDRRA